MTMRCRWIRLKWLVLLSVMQVPSAWGYNLQTHRTITDTAFEQAAIGKGYLEQHLGFRTTTLFRGQTPRLWLQDGSEREDEMN